MAESGLRADSTLGPTLVAHNVYKHKERDVGIFFIQCETHKNNIDLIIELVKLFMN